MTLAAKSASDQWLLAALRSRTDAAIATIESMWGSDFQAESLRTGWTAGHVLTHLARDADRRADHLAERRSGAAPPIDLSRRWDEDPGYLRPGAVLIGDTLDANDRFEEELERIEVTADELPDGVAELLHGRLFEVVIHHADLGEPLSELPADVAADLLNVAVDAIADPESSLRVDSSGPVLALVSESAVVDGSAAELLAWATGRPGAASVAARCGVPSPSPELLCAK